MSECFTCGKEMTAEQARFTNNCLTCLTEAVEKLTAADIAEAMNNLIDYDKNGGVPVEDLRKELEK